MNQPSVSLAPAASSDVAPDQASPAESVDRRYLRGVLSAGVTAAAVYASLAQGLLAGPAALLLGLALIVATPTAPGFSQRVAVNGGLVMGWVPFLWWSQWPIDLDHGAAVLAAGAALLGLIVASSPTPRRRLAELLPAWRLTDAAVPLAGAAGLLAMGGWESVATPREALLTMLPGVDNATHFQIFATMRDGNAELRVLAASPDGTAWAGSPYPAAFHSLVATISELLTPRLDSGPEALVSYTRSVSVLVLLAVMVLVAAAVSLPRLQGRLELAAPAATLTCMAFLWEPGQKVIADGFASFWVGTVAAACALLLALDPVVQGRLPRIAAVGGLLVTVAHTWTLLLVVAAPAALLLLTADVVRPSNPRRRLPPWALVPGLVVFGGLVLAGWQAVSLVATMLDFDTLVRATGGITGTSPLPTFVLLVTAFVVCLGAPRWVARRPGSGPDDRRLSRRIRLVVVAPLLATASLSVLLVAQLRVLGTSSYYFLKYLIGVELILAGVVPALVAVVVAMLVDHVSERTRRLTGVLAVALATQAFGPFPAGKVGVEAQPGGTASLHPPYSAAAVTDGVLRAVAASSRAASFRRTYVALGTDRTALAFYPDSWYHAIMVSSTGATVRRAESLRRRLVTPRDAAPAVSDVLADDPRVVVLVAPAYAPALRRELGEEGTRVVTELAARP